MFNHKWQFLTSTQKSFHNTKHPKLKSGNEISKMQIAVSLHKGG
uniref:Uncharacterized protein n=1 Tax=Arundo donax TaxID=35708 RepID=A0A0A9FGA8_ARUDO